MNDLEKQKLPPAARRFWNFARDGDTGERTLYLDGVIASEPWLDDDITPKLFRKELFAENGNITIWLNSPGGCVFAASQIYSMLMEYKGSVTIKIDGIAASAASVVAMAGTQVLMSPTACLMVHNPSTIALGDSEEMLRAKAMLDEVKESIINAYELRTSLSRTQLSHMMNAETWLSAKKAIEMGFADGLLEDEKRKQALETYNFSRQAVTNSLLDRLKAREPKPAPIAETTTPTAPQTTIQSLDERLILITGGYKNV